MTTERITIRGARQHNLRNVDLDIPKRALVVFTGPSGSGKSSLAFDTLFAEGQRRYVESLSVYARQFLGQTSRPDCDELRGLAPTISIEQKATTVNPRSTLGTITEIHDYLRVMWARLGRQHCQTCGNPVGRVAPDQMAEELGKLPAQTRFLVLAPLVRNRKGEFRDLFDRLRRIGFVRVRLDGRIFDLADLDKVQKNVRHTIDVVVDRLIATGAPDERLRTAVARALEIGDGRLLVRIESGDETGREILHSTHNFCEPCGIAYPELVPQSFSFNSPLGQCPACAGLGVRQAASADLVIPDPQLSIDHDAIAPFIDLVTDEDRWCDSLIEAFCAARKIDRKAPWNQLPASVRDELIAGATEVEKFTVKGRKTPLSIRFPGILALVDQRVADDRLRIALGQNRWEPFLRATPCPDCEGTRLRPESRAVRVGDRTLPRICSDSIEESTRFFDQLELTGTLARIGDELLREVRARMHFLDDVGLGYLSLDRAGPTLSGGEAQRIRLASQVGSDLTGVLYILDEPSIGLHQRDNRRLVETLQKLRDRGNSVLVVEHDRETMVAADWIVDFGPGAGRHGGEVVFSGPPAKLVETVGSVTGDFLAGRRDIPVPSPRRPPAEHAIRIVGAAANNLRHVNVDIPVGRFVCITGVSGAGKSTLVNDILVPATFNALWGAQRPVGQHEGIWGLEHFDKLVEIDQQPIGRTPRSNPSTYTKVFDDIRKIFAELPESKMYGYAPGRFSFNVKGGRCDDCMGAGVRRIEMMFMPDSWVRCETCLGRRFNESTLRVKYRGHNIADVLDLTVADAAELFDAHPRIRRVLQTILDVGLGYIQLGQSSTTVSGGEAQRMKLARELARVATGRTLYLLDEPSTGLHFDDIRKLLDVLHRLVDAGNTVLVIEHNLDIIKVADHVIDLGPEGGAGGGEVVAVGTPEQVARCSRSHTGRYLDEILQPPPP